MNRKRVLIVDDEPRMQRILELMLLQMGHVPLLAGNGREALDLLQAEGAELVVSDLQMPVMDGLELLARIREQGSDIPFIVITAYGTVESAVAAMKHGACDYIIRPFEMEAVELAITRALALHHIQQENTFLRQEVERGWGEFVGRSPAMRQVYEMIRRVAESKTSVLITGETGTGKELAARAIHHASPRRSALFVPINCAAIPAELLESELFGHAKGAFTGAHRERVGKFEMAQNGTLFLDEITEMNPLLQAKLLRVLQENLIERLGSNEPIPVDVRLIAATNRDPLEALRQRKLREDLYYRIQVFTVELPPLRKRLEDIPLLVEHFLAKLGAKLGIAAPAMEPRAIEKLQAYRWPGNVREMENVMERAMVLSRGARIDIRHLPQDIVDSAPRTDASPDATPFRNLSLEPAVEELERNFIAQALARAGGNKARAARLLEISERSLWYKLKKYGLG
ncbi:MAG TPA: sigma-54 dependent transcriptional regulator [Methylococcaceae bacterium]|nr:sigma-54 dependent transcriptional regulator [Methylococcaceae bacterium]